MVAISILPIVIIASKARGAGDGFAENARGDLPGDAPFVAAPAAGAFLAAIVDDGVPQAVGLGLVVGGDLEGERFAVAEGRAAVEAEAGNAHHPELHRQHVTLLAGRVVAGRTMDSQHGAVRKCLGVEGRGLQGGAVVPEADGVLADHGWVSMGGGDRGSLDLRAFRAVLGAERWRCRAIACAVAVPLRA